MYKLTPNENVILRISDMALVIAEEGSVSFSRYKAWIAEGNTPEPAETDQEKIDRLTNVARTEKDRLLREADTMELPSYQKRYGITQAQVEAYKNELRDWTTNNTTLAQLENPIWPTRP